MAAVHLADAVGGSLFLGFISAVAFATILAVVAGLTLAGASAVSHDLYACVIKEGKANEADELRVSKMTTLVLGVVAIGLGILFEKQNIAFMVGLAFSIAASCNFPVLFLSMFWSRLTTRGAVHGGWLGLISAVTLMILGPTVWVKVLGHAQAIFPTNTRRSSPWGWPSSGSGSSRSPTSPRQPPTSMRSSSRSSSAPRPGSVPPAPPPTKWHPTHPSRPSAGFFHDRPPRLPLQERPEPVAGLVVKSSPAMGPDHSSC